MRSSVEVLERDVAEMKALADSIRPASDLLAVHGDSRIKAYLSIRRRFDYSALIVALYASFEQFVEDILRSYVTSLAKSQSYGNLPPKLTAKHLRKSAEFLARGEINLERHPGFTSIQIVENLLSCLKGSAEYQLNSIAVTAHDRNIRYEELAMLFSSIGLVHDSLRQADPLIDWFVSDQHLVGPRPTQVPATIIKQRLDELVGRRNDVAHRGGNPSDRLGAEEMIGFVDFIGALARSIHTLLVSEYLQQDANKKNSVSLSLLKGPFRDNSIWVVQPPNCTLYVNQPAFALSKTFLVRWGRIRSLKIKGEDRTTINENEICDSVGVLFDFAAPPTSRVFVSKADDNFAW